MVKINFDITYIDILYFIYSSARYTPCHNKIGLCFIAGTTWMDDGHDVMISSRERKISLWPRFGQQLSSIESY